MSEAKRIPGLDGIRGIAVLLVMGHHIAFPGFAAGFVGVDVFFVLSGFLISGIILARLDAGVLRLSSFYRRRAARIVPALWLMLAALTVFTAFFHAPWKIAVFKHALPFAFTFTTQFQLMRGQPAGPLTHLWSLSWEAFFYLSWPLLLSATRRVRPEAMAIFLFVPVLVCAVVRALVFYSQMKLGTLALAAAINRVDGFVLGSAIAFYLRTPAARRGAVATWRTFAAGALALATFFIVSATRDGRLSLGFGCDAVMLAAALLILICMRKPESLLVRLLDARPLRFTGEISYGLYLWHPPIKDILNKTSLHTAPRWLLFLALSFAIASASYFLVERRFLKGKTKPRPAA